MTTFGFRTDFLFRLSAEGGAALATERKLKGILKAALYTVPIQGGRTLTTELHPLWICKPAV
jgi:hypothetical protein